jgi:protein phosphatase
MTTTRTNEEETRLKEIRMNPEGTAVLMVSALSDVGCVRKNNEDSYGLFAAEDSTGSNLFVIADGMGGAAAGEVASKLAVETVRDSFFGEEGGEVPASLERAIQDANLTIFRRAAEDTDLAGMGTTCTATALRGRSLWVAHVGDSRAYLITGGDVKQLTRDHSLAAELERRGDSRGGASAGAKHVLTRCLGVGEQVAVDVTTQAVEMADGGSLVLCSDGLSNLVDPGEILHLVSMHLPEKACRRLVDLARERGAPDNITVIVARMRAG